MFFVPNPVKKYLDKHFVLKNFSMFIFYIEMADAKTTRS